MALFLTQTSLYRLLSRELPEDVYPDAGNPASFWSTASLAAKAEVLKNAYDALSDAYDNYWPQTADADGIGQHELSRFGSISIDLTLQERRDRVLAKMRALPSMSRPDLIALVAAELPPGTVITIVGLNDSVEGDIIGGTWYLDVSELGVDTYLGAYGSHAYPPDTDLCGKDGSEIGLSPTEWAEYQAQAYTYELRIYDYTPTAAELAAVDRVLTEAESSESTHTIVQLRTVMEPMTALASTSLHLIADNWDGGATWLDESGAGNNAVRVGVPTIEDSARFYQRKCVRAGSGKGFYAPGDDFNASTARTYEILVDDYGSGTVQFLIARRDASNVQVANWLFKNNAIQLEAAVYDTTVAQPWVGSAAYSPAPNVQSKSVIYHVTVDAPSRVMKVYQNGVLVTQVSNPLFGTLGTPTGLSLGIFSRWNQSAMAAEFFSGTLLELLRHEEAMSQATITARVAEFNRLKGY